MKQNVSIQYSSNDFLILEDRAIYFAKNNDYIDCMEIARIADIENIYISWFGILLTGSSEAPNNPLFFGELDKNGVFVESKPIYHLIGEIDSNSIESTNNNRDSNNSLSTLQVFLGSNTLTLLNYSLLDSILNIKLECNSKESKAILEREQIQREQKGHESKTQSPQSTSMLHPILEDNEIKCPHNGVVRLKANKGKTFTSKGIPLVLESDLLNSQILGCTNNIAGVPTPCTSVAVILPSARGLKKFNDDYPIMQDLVASGCLTDKGFPLTCTPKENTFRINSPNPTKASAQEKEALYSQINTAIPSLAIITPFRELEEYYFTPSFYENRQSNQDYITSQSGFYTPSDSLDITLPPLIKDTDYATLDSNTPLTALLKDLSTTYPPSSFSYRICTLRVAYSIYEYLLIIPKTIPRFITKLLKETRAKEELAYGYGRFIDLQRDYVREPDQTFQDETSLHIQGKVLLAPSGCERVRISVA